MNIGQLRLLLRTMKSSRRFRQWLSQKAWKMTMKEDMAQIMRKRFK